VTQIIKELFYSVARPLYQIFREYGTGENMQEDQFVKIVKAYSRNVLQESDIRESFKAVLKSCGRKDVLLFKDFQDHYGIEVPARGSIQAETEVIRKVREWMFIK